MESDNGVNAFSGMGATEASNASTTAQENVPQGTPPASSQANPGAAEGAQANPQPAAASASGGDALPQPTAQPGQSQDKPAENAAQPITDWSQANINLEGYTPDAGALAAFGQMAVSLGLTEAQAQGLAAWQMEYIAKQRQAMTDAGCAELNQEWGQDAGRRQEGVRRLIGRIDQAVGNDSFSKAIAASGADCFAGFVRGLHAMASMLAEDSLQGRSGSTMPSKAETAVEGIMDVFKRARARQF